MIRLLVLIVPSILRRNFLEIIIELCIIALGVGICLMPIDRFLAMGAMSPLVAVGCILAWMGFGIRRVITERSITEQHQEYTSKISKSQNVVYANLPKSVIIDFNKWKK